MMAYYDDPLAASWMAQHFRIRFQATCPGSAKEDDLADIERRVSVADWYFVGDDFGPYAQKLYIHPDSMELLEPRDDDVVSMGGDFPYLVCSTEAYASIGVLYGKRHKLIERECICNFNDKDEFLWWLKEGRIIQRDGKPFHWPLFEGEAL